MKKLIIANFKINPLSLKEAEGLFSAFDFKTQNVDKVICPPFVFLKKGKNYGLGAQNCFYENKGAYTGEVSPSMLKKIGVEYVIIGHSERRGILKETDEEINKKVLACLANNLKPILCIGESLEERKKGLAFKKVRTQIEDGLKKVKDVKNVVVAYEPIWSIGTGKVPSVNEINEMYEFIKEVLKIKFKNGEKARIVYGGSVNSKNVLEVTEKMQGALVGGASLDKKEFVNMIKLLNNEQ